LNELHSNIGLFYLRKPYETEVVFKKKM